jgi:hypothetical protein
LLLGYRHLQNRIDAMYLDKLDGRIDAAFFDNKSAQWRAEQDRLLRNVATHQGANQTYIEEGVQLLHLAHRAHDLFERQEPAEKRRLLNFLLSNCVWKAGVLTAEYRQPFDILALAREAGGGDEVMSGTKKGQFENWLPSLNPPLTISTLGGPAEQVFNAPPSGGLATWTARAGVGRSVSTTEL